LYVASCHRNYFECLCASNANNPEVIVANGSAIAKSGNDGWGFLALTLTLADNQSNGHRWNGFDGTSEYYWRFDNVER
jgi:hypothetical protein